MSTTKKIREKVNTMPDGITFGYQQLELGPSEYLAAAKALQRMVKEGTIERINKGFFYKPKVTVFGTLAPQESELIKPYLFAKGKRIAYITGISLYNKLGLTMQVPNVLRIASRKKRITINLGNVQAKPVKSYVDVDNDNYKILEVLDVIKDFDKIPDMDRTFGVSYLLRRIEKLVEKEIKKMLKYALEYPPRCRAFLGALIEKLGRGRNTDSLRRSLNPLSTYKLGISEALLPTASNWYIKVR